MTKQDSADAIECTWPLLPEYLFFFDIWEDTILWRGKIDLDKKRVTDGEIVTNKRRFGIIPYVEVLGTFTADVYSAEEEKPKIRLPVFPGNKFPTPPEDFESPYDMRRYPEYFDPEFVEWWFAVEVFCSENLLFFTCAHLFIAGSVGERGDAAPSAEAVFRSQWGISVIQ